MEFQAVVLAAGKGSRMTEITAGRPKCLLPVGNQPLLWYPLQMLERAGFKDAIVVVLESVRSEVQTALDRCGLSIQLEIVSIPAGEDWGTADSLRFISKRLKTDIVVVSCDLITDFNLQDLFNIFRKHRASITALFFPSSTEYTGVTPGPKTKNKPERDFVGLDPETSRLVYLRSASDFKETVTLPKVLLKKHQRVSIQSRLLDAHIYIIRRWVVEFLGSEKSFSTLKGELLPYIVKQQLLRPAKPDGDFNASIVDMDTKKDIFQFAAEDRLEQVIREKSTYNDHSNDMRPVYHGDAIRCYGVVAPKACFGVRVNTLPSFCNANSMIMDHWPSITGNRQLTNIHSTAEVKSTQVDPRCFVGEQTSLSEKTSFTASHIGSLCVVESKVRLVSCVVMNGVQIKEGCVLHNCIICDSAQIHSRAELKDCLVGNNYVIPMGSKHANEALTDVDSLMEI